MRSRGRLLGLTLSVALIGALLAGTTSAFGVPNQAAYGLLGDLDLIANSADGDKFVFTPVGGGSQATEAFTANNKAQISETGANLTQFLVTGPSQGQLPYAGLKDHLFGVRAKGEGTGTPASQINDSGPNGQTFTIDLDDSMDADPGYFAENQYMWQATLAFKLKFGATVLIEALDGNGQQVVYPPGHPQAGADIEVTVACTGAPASDCGSDSGNDRKDVTIGDGDEDTLFKQLRISILSPNDGAASLLDEPGFDTVIEVAQEFDGDLGCDEIANEDEEIGGFTNIAIFTRLNPDVSDTDCNTRKLYNLDIVPGTTVQFVPEEIATVEAIYRFDLTLNNGGPNNPLDNVDLRYDKDGAIGGVELILMQWCAIVDASTVPNSAYVNDPDGPGGIDIGDPYFPELDDYFGPGIDGFPAMPPDDDLDDDGNSAGPPTSCLVFSSQLPDGTEDWSGLLDGEDPFYG